MQKNAKVSRFTVSAHNPKETGPTWRIRSSLLPKTAVAKVSMAFGSRAALLQRIEATLAGAAASQTGAWPLVASSPTVRADCTNVTHEAVTLKCDPSLVLCLIVT